MQSISNYLNCKRIQVHRTCHETRKATTRMGKLVYLYLTPPYFRPLFYEGPEGGTNPIPSSEEIKHPNPIEENREIPTIDVFNNPNPN